MLYVNCASALHFDSNWFSRWLDCQIKAIRCWSNFFFWELWRLFIKSRRDLENRFIRTKTNRLKNLNKRVIHFSAYVNYSYNKTRYFRYWKSTKSLSCSKRTIFTSTFLSFLYILAWTEKLCCCGNNSSHLISSLDRWRAGSQVHDDMGHPFHLIRYSISYQKINKKWSDG